MNKILSYLISRAQRNLNNNPFEEELGPTGLQELDRLDAQAGTLVRDALAAERHLSEYILSRAEVDPQAKRPSEGSDRKYRSWDEIRSRRHKSPKLVNTKDMRKCADPLPEVYDCAKRAFFQETPLPTQEVLAASDGIPNEVLVERAGHALTLARLILVGNKGEEAKVSEIELETYALEVMSTLTPDKILLGIDILKRQASSLSEGTDSDKKTDA